MLAAQARSFNARHAVGAAVIYTSDPGAAPLKTTVRAPAEVLSGHTVVVWLEGIRGCVSCSHVRAAT